MARIRWRALAASTLAYALCSLADLASTYYALSTGRAYESNPNTAALLPAPHLLAAREALALALLVLLAILLYRIHRWGHLPILGAAAVRLGAAIHNVLLLLLAV